MTQLIDHLHRNRFFRFIYWAMKIGLGLTFILSGARKLPGVKFTSIPISDPVGLFFEGMYTAGFYWNFVGYYQIVVGILLMTPWWKKLTPLLIFPITINIFLVSLSLHMRGTAIITSLMILGNLYLIIWDLRSYLPLLKIK